VRLLTDRFRSAFIATCLAALTAIGFGLTLLCFWPGVETFDARYVYLAIKNGIGDWQSPVMSVLWKLIDPIAPGPGSMFLLIAALYWGGFGLLAFAVARRGWRPRAASRRVNVRWK